MDDIRINYRTVTLKDLAQRHYLSAPYLSKYIKDKSGSTFSQILTSVRMQRAKSMLMTEGITIEQIATRCGYPNVEHFSRQFKKICGMSPSEYRKTK